MTEHTIEDKCRRLIQAIREGLITSEEELGPQMTEALDAAIGSGAVISKGFDLMPNPDYDGEL